VLIQIYGTTRALIRKREWYRQ